PSGTPEEPLAPGPHVQDPARALVRARSLVPLSVKAPRTGGRCSLQEERPRSLGRSGRRAALLAGRARPLADDRPPRGRDVAGDEVPEEGGGEEADRAHHRDAGPQRDRTGHGADRDRPETV